MPKNQDWLFPLFTDHDVYDRSMAQFSDFHLYTGSRCNRQCDFCIVSRKPDGWYEPLSEEILDAALKVVPAERRQLHPCQVNGIELRMDARWFDELQFVEVCAIETARQTEVRRTWLNSMSLPCQVCTHHLRTLPTFTAIKGRETQNGNP